MRGPSKALAAILMFGWLTACAPPAAPEAGGPPASAPGGGPVIAPHQMTADQCASSGGTMRPVCMLGRVQCVIPYSDAGQPCRDGDDCQGDCRAPEMGPSGAEVTGRCQASSDPCGCFANVEDGRIDAALCVD